VSHLLRSSLLGWLALLSLPLVGAEAGVEARSLGAPELYFPLRAFHYAAPAPWLAANMAEGDSSGTTTRWIDETALSGQRYLRIETDATALAFEWPVAWADAGTLKLRMRSRQAITGFVRVVDAAGAVLAELRVSPQTEWGGVSLPLPTHTGAARLVLTPDSPGQWEMLAIDYLAFDRAGWLADLHEKEAAGHPANLLPHSRFPLGLPQGWTIDRDSSVSTGLQLAATADALTGPSGAPVLRLATRRDGWLRSPSFATWPNAAAPDEALPHVASLWVAGEGALSLRVLAGTQRIAELAIKATPKGATFRLPFTPPADDTLLCLELHWREAVPGLYLDAARVVPARFDDDGRLSRLPVEVTLATRDTEALHGPGQALHLRAYVSAATPGDELHLTATDLYGQMVERRLAVAAPGLVEISLDEPALSPFGSYRVHAWVTSKAGTPRSDVAELITHRLPEPRFAHGAAPESHFGIHVLPTDRHLRMAAAVGLKWARLHGPGAEINYWFNVEREPGHWVFQPERLARYREAGFSVLGKLTSSPRWASGQTEVVHTYFDQFVAPRDLAAWRVYVARLLAEYGAAIDVYEVWNEPWLDKFFSARVELLPDGSRRYVGLPDPAAAFADLTRATRETVDAAAYQPQLIGLNTTTNRNIEGWIDGDEWTRLARAAGALDPVDIFSYHDYDRAADPLAQFDLSRRQFAFALGPELDEAGRAPRPVWNTEGSPQPEGISPGLYQALLPHYGEHTDTVWAEAERLARYLLGQFSVGVEKVFLYTMHNALGFTAGNGFTVLLAPDATLHPTGAALAALARAIDPLPFAELTTLPGGRLLRFGTDEGGRATEVFLADTLAPATLPAGRDGFGPWHDLFGNPVESTPRRGATFFRETN